MPNETDELEVIQKKLELQKFKKDIAVFDQVVEPLVESVEDLVGILKEIKLHKPEEKNVEYFDKELSKKLSDGINTIGQLIAKLKPASIDLSPIKDIADSINSRNADLIKSLTALANLKNDTSGYESLLQQTMAMIQKGNEYFSKQADQINYTLQFDEMNANIKILANRPTSYISTVERSTQYGQPLIKTVTIEPKK